MKIKDKLYKFKNIVIVELLYMLILQIFGAYIHDLSIGQATKKEVVDIYYVYVKTWQGW